MFEYLDLVLETGVFMTAFIAAFDLLCRQVESELIAEVITLDEME